MIAAPLLAQEFAPELFGLLVVEHRRRIDVDDRVPVQEPPAESLGIVGLDDRDTGEPYDVVPPADEV